MKSVKLFFILSFMVLSQSAFAEALQCRNLFSQSSISIPGLHDVLSDPRRPDVIERVTKLTHDLLKENAKLLIDGNLSRIPGLDQAVQIVPVYKSYDLNETAFVRYNFSVNVVSDDGIINRDVSVRSNGKVAFLDTTWMYRKNSSNEIKRYKAAYVDGDGIKTVDQAEIIIDGFPEQMILSRNMSGRERNRWVNDKPYFPSIHYGNRVHFMPHSSRFDPSWEPYFIQISKKELLEFYHRGELEINIYESNLHMDLSKVDVKINFEMVFIGDQGVANLAPYMKAQLQDQNK